MKQKYKKYTNEKIDLLFKVNPSAISKYFSGKTMKFTRCYDDHHHRKKIPHKASECESGLRTMVISHLAEEDLLGFHERVCFIDTNGSIFMPDEVIVYE